MALDYQMGTPLGPDPRAVADLAAIDKYIRESARPRVSEFPDSLDEIEAYEKWRQSVSTWDLMVMVNDTMREAKRLRDLVNAAQNRVIPPDTMTEEGSFVSSPPATKRGGLIAGLLALGVGVGAYAAWRLRR